MVNFMQCSQLKITTCESNRLHQLCGLKWQINSSLDWKKLHCKDIQAMKTRLGCLSNKSDSCSDFSEFLPPAQERSTRYLKLSNDEVTRWADSFDALLSNKYGLAAFRTFLKTEFSDENIEFWLACEDYKKIKSPAKMMSKASKIFKEFIDIHAPREVNIDHRTREETKQRLLEPTSNSLNEVQAKVYSLMEKDSFPRFIRSKIYQDLLNRTQIYCQRKSV
ncbi:regulator of G-protein signaling 8 isoform X1 [Siphateles boraxobius]|uniref:regulator of G-protein signaling 8 isoform X1 n=2 Tax=Siphateles boraxobius TaxID=180520 RepID=UPI0040639789